jgi:hypothetical protein
MRPSEKRKGLLVHPLIKLLHHHVEFLFSWAHRILDERALLFHWRFPELKISASSIGKLYRKHGIRKKGDN